MFRYIGIFPKFHFHQWKYLVTTNYFEGDITFVYFCPHCLKQLSEIYHSESAIVKYKVGILHGDGLRVYREKYKPK